MDRSSEVIMDQYKKPIKEMIQKLMKEYKEQGYNDEAAGFYVFEDITEYIDSIIAES